MCRVRINILSVTTWLFATALTFCQNTQFITRLGDRFQVDGWAFYFLGGNAYYLMEDAARGDTSTVKTVCSTACQLGMRVLRTWGFFDSSDSLNPAAIQVRPGVFNEHAMRALDFVLWQASRQGMHVLLPLVNNWDDYGGMNQYVEWRMDQASDNGLTSNRRFTEADRRKIVEVHMGNSIARR